MDKPEVVRLLVSPPGAGEAIVSVFIQIDSETVTGAWLEIGSVELVGANGVFPLQLGMKQVDSRELSGRQRFLARANVNAGSYKSLRLTIEKSALVRDGVKHILSVVNPVVELPLPADFQLRAQESSSLFIVWDEEESIKNMAFFEPQMRVVSQKQPLLADLAYVSCPEIDTVFMVRTDKNWVVGSFAISGEPTYLEYNSDKKNLLVMTEKGAEIHVVKAATGQTQDRIKIPMTARPVAMVSPDGLYGYILDGDGGFLLKVDLEQGTLSQRVRLGGRPQFLAWLEESAQLVAVSEVSQSIIFVDPESLTIAETMIVGNSPSAVLASEGYLYVTERMSNSLGIYDFNTRQLQKRVSVGFEPRRLFKLDDILYVSNYSSSSLSLLLTGQQRMLHNIQVGGHPFNMAASSRNRWLYVVEQEVGRIAVIDQTMNRVVSHIELGASPFEMVTVQ
ncbi:MAG: YncE family protein [Desulfobulbaceae bacterium]|nr:YncE family protein [Desulfobulbaceae bacterium]